MSSEEFDPYRKWLGIPQEEQPPHHYRLLGIALFEEDADVIQHAADRQMAHVRTFKLGRYAKESQHLLNELAAAKVCLLTPEDKSPYDESLRESLAPSVRPVAPRTPPPAPAMPPPAAPPAAVAPPEPIPAGLPVGGIPSGGIPSRLPMGVAPVAVVTAPVGTLPGGRPVPIAPAESPEAGPMVRSSAPRGRGGDKDGGSMWMILVGVGAAAAIIVGVVVAMNNRGSPTPPKPVDPGTTRRPDPRPLPPLPKPGTTPKKPDPEEFVPQPPVSVVPMPMPSGEPQLEKELTEARQSLKRRNLEAARRHLVDARFAAKDDAEGKARVEQLEALSSYVQNFWDAVRKGVYDPQLEKTSPLKFEVRDRTYELLRREGEMVTYRVEGREATHKIRELPAFDAVAFARHGWRLRKEPLSATETAWNDLYIASFLAFDRDNDREGRGERLARTLWKNAAEAGVVNPFVAKELGLEKEVPAGTAIPTPPTENTTSLPMVGPPMPNPPLPNPMPRPMPSPPVVGPRPMPNPTADGRTPLPTAAELKAAHDKLRAQFVELYDKSRADPNGKVLLASTLVEESQKPEGSAAHRYAALAKAWELAAEAGRIEPALSILEVAAEEFAVDQLAEKIACLDKAFGPPPPSAEVGTEVAAAATLLYDEAMTNHRYEAAGEAARVAGRGAKAAGDGPGERKAREQGDQVRDLATDQKGAERTAKVLEMNPEDPAANFLVGRFKCLGLEQWEVGLPMLARGSDKELKDLAALELAGPATAAEQLKVGAGWLIFGKRRSGLGGQRAVKHALPWLEKAEGGGEGAVKEEAAAKRKEAAAFAKAA